ncbi:MAG: hypothetical protein STSR0008_24920 [Ignavibacterium sp.]
MLKQKKKITRKEIKQDSLVTFYYKAISFYEEYRRQILIGFGAIAVVALIMIYTSQNRRNNNEKASLDLFKVMNLYDAGAYLEAIEGRPTENIKGLKKIVQEFDNTENGETAKIYLANAYYFLGKTEDAFKYYKDYDGDNPLLVATSLAGQAAYYESKKDYKKSAELYNKAASVSELNVLNPQYLLFAGINYMKIGNNEKAKNLFKSIKKEYQTSPYLRDVDKYLTQLD